MDYKERAYVYYKTLYMDRNLYSIHSNYESLCEKRRFHATKCLLLLYVYMFIEAMADAAVAQGLPRKQAYTFAAQTLLGSAKMVLETGQHPGELKDAVSYCLLRPTLLLERMVH